MNRICGPGDVQKSHQESELLLRKVIMPRPALFRCLQISLKLLYSTYNRRLR